MNLHATNKTSCANNLQDTTNEAHKNVHMISDNQLKERNVYILLVYCSIVVSNGYIHSKEYAES